MESPEPTDLAYIAAFLDADGSVTLHTTQFQPFIRFSNRSRNLLEWINSQIPGGDIRIGAISRIGNPVYHLRYTGRDRILAVGELILQYVKLKHDELVWVLAYARRLSPGTPITHEEQVERDQIIREYRLAKERRYDDSRNLA